MSAETELTDVHNAYKRYIEDHHMEPKNPTQLLNYCQKHCIANITWSKTSRYFKSFRDPKSSTNGDAPKPTSSAHKKTPSYPLTATSVPSTDPLHPHKRSQSAVDAKQHKNQFTHETKPFPTVQLNELLTELAEEYPHKTNKARAHNGASDDDFKSSGSSQSSKSFRSILIEQKLPPLSATQEAAPSITIDKSVAMKNNKHRFLQKPWNKNKPSNWPKERMQMTRDLKGWLKQNKFDKFAAKLYHYGIESMDDLRLLCTEDIIEDLCGKTGVHMTIIYRRKFIQKTLALNAANAPHQNVGASPFEFEFEMQAVQALASRMQSVTETLRTTKQLQAETEKRTNAIKQSVADDFDALIKRVALRKKQLLQAIDTRHKITVRRLQEQYTNLSQTAVCLLETKQCIAPQIKETKMTAERKDFVIGTVQSCFEQCDKYTPSDYDFLLQNEVQYEQGSDETAETIEAFGKVIFNTEQIV